MGEPGLKIVKFFGVLILLLGITFSCGKVEESVIPDVDFAYTIDLTIYNEFNVAGNSILIPGVAYGGVIVYCETPGSFYAYDAACTHEVSTSCYVGEPNTIGSITVTCPCCSTEYVLIGGSPISGPAVQPLRPYNVSSSGSTLRIYN